MAPALRILVLVLPLFSNNSLSTEYQLLFFSNGEEVTAAIHALPGTGDSSKQGRP
jgi:hypothetical protein